MTGPLVVVGDALLDVDLEGSADRLCPEAPVPVVDVAREWQRPGGAGLAARLAARSVSEVVLVTAFGDDEAGARLGELLRREVEPITLPLSGETPRKTRIRAGGHSVARIDRGTGRAVHGELPDRVRAALLGAGAILVADYGRGVAAHPDVLRLLAARTAEIPVVWDPHPRGARPVPGARLVTPNDAEAARFAGTRGDLGELAAVLRDRWGSSGVAVTAGDRGAVLAGPGAGKPRAIPVPGSCRIPAGAIPDTCGAGDRFASAATAALFEGGGIGDAVVAAVEAAARFVAAGAAGSLSECPRPAPRPVTSGFELAAWIRRQGGKLVATGGCFDLLHPGHVSLLQHARSLGDALIVCLNSDDSVRRRKGPGRPIVSEADRARLLRALEPVDAVLVFDEATPARLLDELAPEVWVKGGDYVEADLPEAEVVRRHGGEVVLVPMVAGYSTTRLVTAAHGTR
ncbi:D-glycero-beta-D-manno-heptose 1-phosphate adenylyltransferase [Amycolatopsis anabasis]|uniref:D-glycero-beta-D-manno-heptose 1-phosphate adenylyltransferase n=1 Tax=Amycolatopsis anabasis TaxID=1840409 RepID=UPI00131E11E1|nr:D-glycero-beta-D-manno-heptose 1-phosphate adenylyltransferase [Amycolatopsis anabasis]